MNRKQSQLYKALLMAYDVAEGQYSGIPQCCINAYIKGRTWMSLIKNLSKQERDEMSRKYNYVPCAKCVEKGKVVEIRCGKSNVGTVLLTLLEEVMRNKHV